VLLLGNIFFVLFLLSSVLLGGLYWALDAHWIPFHSLLLGLGLGALALSLVINGRVYLGKIRSDSSRFIVQAGLSLALLGFFLSSVNYLSRDLRWGLDFSPGGKQTLNETTHKIIDPLIPELKFHLFYLNNPEGAVYKSQIQQAFQIIRRQKPEIGWEEISIFENPEKVKKFNVGDSPYALFVTYKDKTHRMQGGLSEKDIVSAAVKVSQPEKIVYIWKNVGKRNIEEQGTYGLSLLKANLEKLYYRVETLDRFPVPEDAAMLAIIGTKVSWSSEKQKQLQSYMEEGGHLLLAGDPDSSEHFSEFLDPLGVSVSKRFAKRPEGSQSPFVVFTLAAPDHPELSQVLAQGNPYFYLAAPLKFSKEHSLYKATPLLLYEAQTQVFETLESPFPYKPEDQQAKVAAALIESRLDSREKAGRLIVLGDSDIFTNQLVTQQDNFSLAVGLFNFLSQDSGVLNIAPKRAQTNYLLLSQTQLNFYFLFFILPVPLLFFLLAIVFRLRRAF